MRIWSFSDNGVINGNGGLYGLFTLKARGLGFLGAISNASGGGFTVLDTTVIRAHYLGKPLLSTTTGAPNNYQNTFADGIPMQTGSFFKLPKVFSDWYISVPNNGLGSPTVYIFLIVEECDEDIIFGNMGFSPQQPD